MSSFFAGHGFHLIQSIHYIHHSSNQTPRLAPCPPCFAFTSWHPPLRIQTLARTWKLVHANPPNLARRGSKSLPPEMVSWRPAQRFCWTKRSALLWGKKLLSVQIQPLTPFTNSVDPCRPSIVWEYNRNKVSICIVFPAAKSACPRVSKWTI